jgi:hypothetical protein
LYLLVLLAKDVNLVCSACDLVLVGEAPEELPLGNAAVAVKVKVHKAHLDHKSLGNFGFSAFKILRMMTGLE